MSFDLPISLDVSDADGDFLVEESYSPLLLSGQTSLEFAVETLQDEVDENHGSVEVTILASENHEKAIAPDDVASVTVLDDDVPVISLDSTAVSVMAGESFKFIVHASSEVDNDLNISLAVTETKEYINELDYTNLIIPAGTSTGEIVIQTIISDTFNGIGHINLKVLAGSDYRLEDDQDFLFATATIEETEAPTGISIRAESNLISENHATGTVRFYLYSNEQFTTDQTVDLEVSTTGSFFNLNSNTIQHIIPAGVSESVLEIPLIDDTIDEIAGSIEVSVSPGDIILLPRHRTIQIPLLS